MTTAVEMPVKGRWPMALRGFLCQNVAIGCAFGGFGVTVLPIQEQFGVSRGMATLGLALAVLAMGIFSPFVATMITRFGLRLTMIGGIVLSGLGYVMLALAPSMGWVLAAYAIPIGMGVAMFGSFPSSILANTWFQPNAGLALGIVNTPLMVALLPMLAIFVIKDHGLSSFYFSLAAMHLALLPVAFGIADAPVRTTATNASTAHDMHADGLTNRAIFRMPMFWVMVIGGGALSAAGITGVSHLVAFGMERGVSSQLAALLVSVMGGASIVGSLLVGLICTRIGAARTLALIGGGLAASWLVLLATTSVPVMIAATLIIGTSGAGVFPAVNVLAAQVFGTVSLARVLGLFGLSTLPMTFILPPLAGVLHDAADSYNPVVGAIVGICTAVVVLFLVTAKIVANRNAAAAALMA